MNASRIIPVVVETFGDERTPVVSEAWRSQYHRWDRAAHYRRVSRSFLRELRRMGYTRVRLGLDGRHHEFTIEDLLR